MFSLCSAAELGNSYLDGIMICSWDCFKIKGEIRKSMKPRLTTPSDRKFCCPQFHYENAYSNIMKMSSPKTEKFRIKNSDIFRNIDCWYR